MKKHLIPIFLSCAALSAAFCTQQPLPHNVVNDNSFTLECTSDMYNAQDSLITFPVAGGAVTFRVNVSASSVAWGMRCDLDENWCKYVKSVETFSVKAGENTGGQRESEFYVVVGENAQRIKVLQEYIPTLAFVDDTVYVKFVGENLTVNLTTNIKDNLIVVTSDKAWASDFKVTRSKLSFKVAANDVPEDRWAQVVVAAENLSDTLFIRQDMFGKEPNPLDLPSPIWSPVVNL